MVWIMTPTTLSGTSPAEGPEAISAFKRAFRRHAAGVAVVTALRPDGTPVGFTATSLASLAAVPPVATFNMARVASAWAAIESTDYVIIHLLGMRNRELAVTLAGPHHERFSHTRWRTGPHGVPLFTDVTAWMVGRIIARVPIEASAVVAVEIDAGGLGEPDDALVYHDRQYTRPEPGQNV